MTGGVWFLVRISTLSFGGARGGIVWITNSQALVSSISALSESLFTALGGASLLFWAEKGGAGQASRRLHGSGPS